MILHVNERKVDFDSRNVMFICEQLMNLKVTFFVLRLVSNWVFSSPNFVRRRWLPLFHSIRIFSSEVEVEFNARIRRIGCFHVQILFGNAGYSSFAGLRFFLWQFEVNFMQ